VVPAALIASSRKFVESADGKKMAARLKQYAFSLDLGRRNLLRAYQLGVPLATGTDSGNPLVFHGPGVHRELQLWVEAGIPAAVALQGATSNPARLLGHGGQFGSIKIAADANLLIVNGNPLKDIKATENISSVLLKGERISRSELFDQEQ
jgi:imidazolonepropionase-like amidohydrolase